MNLRVGSYEVRVSMNSSYQKVGVGFQDGVRKL